jgi:cbb3-type cytochrome oxidase subunit 1
MVVAGTQREARAQATLSSVCVGSATFGRLITTAIAVLLSFTFPFPDLATSPYLSFGCLRAIQTNGMFCAFAWVALSGFAIYLTARSPGAIISAKPLACVSLRLFNISDAVGNVNRFRGLE